MTDIMLPISPARASEVEVVISLIVSNLFLTKYEGVDEEDAKTYVSILVETGLIDCNSYKEDFYKFMILSDIKFESERGRITYVRIGHLFRNKWRFHTDRVFKLLAKLERMESLVLSGCLFGFAEIVSKFTNLRVLKVNCWREKQITNCLRQEQITIGSLALLQGKVLKLEYLKLNCEIASEDDLAMFLFDVLPFFPKLRVFRVKSNRIKSFRRIAQRIKNNNNNERFAATTSRLRHLDLGYCDMGKMTFDEILYTKKMFNHLREVEAIKNLLLAYKELYDFNVLEYRFFEVGGATYRKHRFFEDDGIKYLKEINFAGRVLVETNEDNSIVSTNSVIPLSVWPTVLARFSKWFSSDPRLEHPTPEFGPDGIYYLLQNVEALREGSKRQRKR